MKLLDERKKTHGNFEDNARVSQELKRILYRNQLEEFTDVQAEALDMICLKLSRICSNPNYADNWDDLAGYSTLAAKEL